MSDAPSSCSRCGTALVDGAAFCAECGAPAAWSSLPPPPPVLGPPAPPRPPAPGRTATARSARTTAAAAIGLGGALLVGVASFLPWAEVTTSLLRTTEASVSGWDWYDGSVQTGPVFAAFALIVAGLAGLTFAGTARNPARLGLVAAGALTLGLAIYALVDVLGDGDDLETIGSVDVEVSYGLAVLVVASIAVIGAGILAEPES